MHKNFRLKKTLWPLFMDWVQRVLLRVDSLLFTIQFPGVPDTQLIDLGRMKS